VGTSRHNKDSLFGGTNILKNPHKNP
jgi:hypothetical protein